MSHSSRPICLSNLAYIQVLFRFAYIVLPATYLLAVGGGALTLNQKSGLGSCWFHACVSFLSMLEPAVSICSRLLSAQLWIEINAMDKAIKTLFVPFVTTG